MARWDRQEGEPNNWWVRFEKFRKLGLRRSALAVYNEERAERGMAPAATCPGAWVPIIAQWEWRERAAEWDKYLIEQDRLQWQARRTELRSREWDVADRLLKRGEEMLAFPVGRVTREDGGKITIVEPADWRLTDIPRVVEAASKLARLASGMATDSTDVFNWDPDDCTPEQLRRIKNGEQPRDVLTGGSE